MEIEPREEVVFLTRRLAVGARWVAVALLLAATTASGAPSTPVLAPVVLWVPEEYHTGGAYTAIQSASDGRVYLGTTFYNGFARLLVLPRGSQSFELIASMAQSTGESTPGPYAQAKIHTKPAIAPDGKVYFGTKSGKPAKDERWQANYPGGHLLVYDPQTRQVTNFGIPRPRQSIIAVGVDPRRNIVYALTDPEIHLITFDPRTRTFADKGQLASGIRGPTRYLVVLANGNVFHPVPDAFTRYNAAAGRIDRLPLRFSGRGTYESPYALAANADGERFHGVGRENGQVYTFTPGEQGIEVQLHGAVVPEGYSLPGTYYTMAAAPDGSVYYTGTFARGSVLFVMRLGARATSPEMVGQVAPLPPTPPGYSRGAGREIQVQGSTVGPDGTLYVMLAYPLRVLVFPRMASRP
jgi:hypothetical protein